MKENLNNREFLDIRKLDTQLDPIDLIKSITSNLENTENDPFYIVDLEDICNKHINWITRLPRVEPHYAVKCNTDTMVLKLLAYLGTGFDCASKNEIQTILDLGVSPHRIIFANPCKQTSNIKYANKVGVDLMTFDNEAELYKIKEHHPNAQVVLRIITNDEDAVCRFSMKFGADMETSYGLIETAINLGLDLVGISFHVGSGQMSPKAFTESIENARKLFDFARENYGCRMTLLDLGGGYPGSSDLLDLFEAVSAEINRSLDKFFPAEFFSEANGYNDDDRKFRIIAEPGRYYVASAFTLSACVIAKRANKVSRKEQQKQQEEKAPTSIESEKTIDASKSIMYYINDGVYASFNCIFYDHTDHTPVLLAERSKNVTHYKSSIWGPTCDGLDCVVKESLLPELNIGEFMVFQNMGAYTLSGAVAFNGIPLAKCIYVASTSWETIKSAFDELDESIQSSNGSATSVSTTSCAASLLNAQFKKKLNFGADEKILPA